MMGYRSDVTYAIAFKDIDAKRKFVALNKIHPRYSKALEECQEVESDLLYIIFEHNYVKWYDGYEDVAWHMDMLSDIDADSIDGVAAKLVRIGEDHGDVEELHFQGDSDYEPNAEEIPIEAHVVSEIVNKLPRSNQIVTTS